MLHSGIDVHKRSCGITTVDSDGTVHQHEKLPTSRLALHSYFARLPGPHHATIEATGSWYWLRDSLTEQGVHLTLAHAKFLKAIVKRHPVLRTPVRLI